MGLFRQSLRPQATIPTRASLRRVLLAVLRTDADLTAFCTDHFPDVAARFGDSMDRLVKFNLLLQSVPTDEILRILRQEHTEATARCQDLIALSDGNDALPSSLLDARERRNRQRLIEKVRKFWIEGVLEKSLHGAVMIELGKEYRPDAVAYPWDMVLERPDALPQPIPHGTRMIELFDENLGELLILGEPGSGKTTMLLDLCRDLLTRAQQDELQPIPVVFNLSSWGRKKLALDEWIIEELYTRYGESRECGKQWIATDSLLVLLDGLDETDSQSRQACVRSISEFKASRHIALCCRANEYAELESRLSFTQAVYLQPLSHDDINQYLQRTGISQVQSPGGEALLELAKTPLLLSIISLLCITNKFNYTQLAESTMHSMRGIFDEYIKKMLTRRSSGQRFLPSRTLTSLHWLAKYGIRAQQAQFELESLRPTPLMRRASHRKYLLLSCLFYSTCIISFGISVTALILYATAGGEHLDVFVLKLQKSLAIDTKILFWSVLSVGLFLGLCTGTMISYGNTPVRTSEKLQINWDAILSSAGFSATLVITILVIDRVKSEEHFLNLPAALLVIFFSLIVGAILGFIFAGFEKVPIESINTPNERIFRSIKNVLFMAACAAATIGIILFVIKPPKTVTEFVFMLPSIIWLGVTWGLLHSGAAPVQHFILRFVLFLDSYIPLRLILFLDSCSSIGLLRKVGGSYIFVHRLIMEYFAALTEEDIQRLAAHVEPRR